MYFKRNDRLRILEIQNLNDDLRRKRKHYSEEMKKEMLGYYKRMVVETFVATFVNNYGTEVDQNSIVDSLSFSIEETKEGLVPSFTFDYHVIKFKSDFRFNIRKFNYNVFEEFTPTSIELNPDILMQGRFSNNEEQEAFEEPEKLGMSQSLLLPIDDSERYTEYNRINKLGGYSSCIESGDEATTLIERIWKGEIQ